MAGNTKEVTTAKMCEFSEASSTYLKMCEYFMKLCGWANGGVKCIFQDSFVVDFYNFILAIACIKLCVCKSRD